MLWSVRYAVYAQRSRRNSQRLMAELLRSWRTPVDLSPEFEPRNSSRTGSGLLHNLSAVRAEARVRRLVRCTRENAIERVRCPLGLLTPFPSNLPRIAGHRLVNTWRRQNRKARGNCRLVRPDRWCRYQVAFSPRPLPYDHKRHRDVFDCLEASPRAGQSGSAKAGSAQSPLQCKVRVFLTKQYPEILKGEVENAEDTLRGAILWR